MSCNDIEAKISFLHGAYQKFTGLELPLKAVCDDRKRAWGMFMSAGHNVHELETVILYAKSKIREKVWKPGMLGFRRLIEDLNNFEELLAQAKAEARNAKPKETPKARVLRDWRPTVSEQVTHNAKPASEWIERMRKAVNEPGSAPH